MYSELDWVVDNDTVVRPDCMIVCGDFKEEYLVFAPSLIIEISSHSTKLRDRNMKFNLYELKKVRFYIIADPENKTVDSFELINEKYQMKTRLTFEVSAECNITIDSNSLWESM